MDEFRIDDEYLLKLNSQTNFWDTYQYGQLLSRTTQRLFKYFSLNDYSIDGLSKSYFYLSNPVSFNDPFDCNLNLTDDIGNLDDAENIKRNNLKNIGICSFSETIDNHLMWAHYAKSYNGFVLEFGGNSIQVKLNREEINKITLARVIYTETPVKISSNLPFAYHYLLTTKSKQWYYEKEWRIIIELNSSNREIEYYPESIRSIYIGYKIFEENQSMYKLLLEQQEKIFPHAQIFIVYPHPTDLNLKFEKVR